VTHRGPKLRDTIRLVERVAEILVERPDASANEIARLSGARRSDVLRVVRLLRPGPVFLSSRERGAP
jgi:hypothetical protein